MTPVAITMGKYVLEFSSSCTKNRFTEVIGNKVLYTMFEMVERVNEAINNTLMLKLNKGINIGES